MTHEEVQALLAAVPWNRLDEAGQANVEEHLATCESCREDLRFERSVHAGLAPLRKRRETLQGVMGKIRRGSSASQRAISAVRSSRRIRSVRPSSHLPAAAASVLMAGAGLAIYWYTLNYNQPAESGAGLGTAPVVNPAPALAKSAAESPLLIKPANKPEPLAAAAKDLEELESNEARASETVVALPEEKAAVAAKPPDEQAVPMGMLNGHARLRPIAAGANAERDSLRLFDGAIGLDLFEADLRIVKLSGTPLPGVSEVLAVSLGGGNNAARLIDLGKAGQFPKTVAETDALPIEMGRNFLLRLDRSGREAHFLLKVNGHKPGECVDLEWNFVETEQAKNLVAQVSPQPRPLKGKAGKGDEVAPPDIMAAPDRRKKKL